jgi:hypothetical protein
MVRTVMALVFLYEKYARRPAGVLRGFAVVGHNAGTMLLVVATKPLLCFGHVAQLQRCAL